MRPVKTSTWGWSERLLVAEDEGPVDAVDAWRRSDEVLDAVRRGIEPEEGARSRRFRPDIGSHKQPAIAGRDYLWADARWSGNADCVAGAVPSQADNGPHVREVVGLQVHRSAGPECVEVAQEPAVRP